MNRATSFMREKREHALNYFVEQFPGTCPRGFMDAIYSVEGMVPISTIGGKVVVVDELFDYPNRYSFRVERIHSEFGIDTIRTTITTGDSKQSFEWLDMEKREAVYEQ